MKCYLRPGAAFLLGITVAFGLPFVSDDFAAWYSQEIYDCAIRVADDGHSGSVSIDGWVIEGSHDYGLCISRSWLAERNKRDD